MNISFIIGLKEAFYLKLLLEVRSVAEAAKTRQKFIWVRYVRLVYMSKANEFLTMY